jgi:large subunit ribosomal protein L10
MNRDEKTEIVEDLRGRFAASPFVILANFQGSNPLEMDAIRKKFHPIGVHFRVVKNTLARRAIAGTEMAVLEEHFKGNTGVIFSGEDAQGTARLFKELLKENDKLVPKAGFFDGTVLDGKGIAAVAELPSREQLLATLLGTLQAAPRQVLGLLQAPARDLLYLLHNRADQLEKQA